MSIIKYSKVAMFGEKKTISFDEEKKNNETNEISSKIVYISEYIFFLLNSILQVLIKEDVRKKRQIITRLRSDSQCHTACT